MDPAYVAAHLEENREHWWFRGRRAVILAGLGRALTSGPHRLRDVGCGTGNVLEALGRFGEAVGMEADATLVAAAFTAGLDVRCGALSDNRVVPVGWPDVVLLLDVIEHLDAAAAALRAAHALLEPGAARSSPPSRPTGGAATMWCSAIAAATALRDCGRWWKPSASRSPRSATSTCCRCRAAPPCS